MTISVEKHIETYNKTQRQFGNIRIIKAGTFGYYDVFLGNGWTNHTRVLYNKQRGTSSFVSGKELGNLIQEVNKCIAQLTK